MSKLMKWPITRLDAIDVCGLIKHRRAPKKRELYKLSLHSKTDAELVKLHRQLVKNTLFPNNRIYIVQAATITENTVVKFNDLNQLSYGEPKSVDEPISLYVDDTFVGTMEVHAIMNFDALVELDEDDFLKEDHFIPIITLNKQHIVLSSIRKRTLN